MSDQKNDGFFGALALVFFFIIIGAFAGPATIAEKSRDSTAEKVFIWLFIRSFWFGAGALVTYLCMK